MSNCECGKDPGDNRVQVWEALWRPHWPLLSSACWSAISFPSFPILTSVSFWLPIPDYRPPVTELSRVSPLLLLYKQMQDGFKVSCGDRFQCHRCKDQCSELCQPKVLCWSVLAVNLIQPRIPWGVRLTRSGWPWSCLWEVVLIVNGERPILDVGGSISWSWTLG